MKFIADFSDFLRETVNLNQTRLDLLQSRVESIEDFIAASEDFEDSFIDIIPAGSWAHRTIIRPPQDGIEFDADILCHLKENDGWQPADYIEHLYSTFRDSARYRDMVSRKTRCLRVNYQGDFHIDIVPYLTRQSRNWITNRTDPPMAGSFELSSPDQFTAWINDRQKWSNFTFTKVVRLLKYLRDIKRTFTCKSIILTTLIGGEIKQIDASYNSAQFADVPTTLRTLLDRLAASLPEGMPAVYDPAGTGDNFSERYKDDWDYANFRKWIKHYARRVGEAYDETDRAKSAQLWRDIFGEEFKQESLKKSAADTIVSANTPCPTEEKISEAPYAFPMELDPRTSITVTGRCTGLKLGKLTRRNGFRQFDLPANGNRVPKDREILFTATVVATQPYSIYWKIRNGGAEAAAAGELRGDIHPDEGRRQRTESTAYKGTHYVECYLVKDGKVRARDRQVVHVT